MSFGASINRLLGPLDQDCLASRAWASVMEAPECGDVFRDAADSWLKQYKAELIAGRAFLTLLQKSPRARYVKMAKEWARRNPESPISALLAGELLGLDSSKEVVDMCIHYVNSELDTGWLKLIFHAMHKRPRARGLFRAIEERLERDPAHREWEFLYAPRRDEPCKPVERIILKWIKLNANHPRLCLMRLLAPPPTPAIIEASFDWSSGPGRDSPWMVWGLPYLVEAAVREHKKLLPRVIEFTREWLAQNPDDERAGHVHYSLGNLSGTDHPGCQSPKNRLLH